MKTKVLITVLFLLLLCGEGLSYEVAVTGHIPLQGVIDGVSLNPDTGKGATISGTGKVLYIIDVPSASILHKIDLSATPTGVAVDARRNTVVVSSSDGILSFFDMDTKSLLKTIAIGKELHCIALDKEDDRLFIAGSNVIMIMELETEEIVKEISLPAMATGLDIDNPLGYILITMQGTEGLSLYSLSTFEPITLIRTKETPAGLAANPSTHVAVITNQSENSLSVISLESKGLLDTILFSEPSAVAIDPTRNIAAIGHKDGITIVKLENPVPAIERIIPESAGAGSSGFTLSIQGSKFIRDSKARFNLKELSTFFEDNSNLKALVPPEELLLPGEIPVTVLTPRPGGGVSNSAIFRLTNPMPQIESLAPDVVALIGAQSNLRVWGKNFLPTSVVNLNGRNLKTKFKSSILLEAQLDLTDITKPARYPVIVTNPSPLSLTSNVAFLTVVLDASLLATESTGSKDTESQKKIESEKPTGILTGRILNTNKEPIEGVTIRIRSLTTQTDAGGYFTLTDVPSGRQYVMIHGPTAIEPDSHYPTIPLTISIEADKVNEMPFQIYLHRQKNYNFKDINPDEDTVLTDPEVPGFEMRIPKGVRITGWDGQTNLKVSVRTVPADRLPVKPIPNNSLIKTVYMFYFDKIGGGVPDSPIPVKSPNDLNLLPGQKAVLWYYDESPIEGEAPNDWAIAGTGTVTPDGQYIVADPGVGIPKFCCGAIGWGGAGGGAGGPGGPPPPPCPGCCNIEGSDSKSEDCPTAPCGAAGDPVDLATGTFVYSKTDMHIPGIIPVNFKRYYRAGDTNIGAFGKSTFFEYDWWLGAYDANGNLNDTDPTTLLLVKPGNSQYSFPKQPDGTFINTVNPEFKGAVVTYNATDYTRTLKMRDGTQYKFDYRDRMSGELIEIADRNGNRLTFTRTPRPPFGDDQGGYLTRITTAEGRTVTYSQTYTGNFFRTDSITDSDGRTVRYTYENDPFSVVQRLKQVQYPDGGTVTYGYDPGTGFMTSITNERGIVEVVNQYYADDPLDVNKKYRVYTQRHADGGTYVFNYTAAGGYITQTTMTSPNNGQTTWQFNSNGYITQKTTPDGPTVYEREAGTNLVKSVTDPLGRKTTYTYYYTTDATNGLIKTATDTLGNVTAYEYETRHGLTTKITDALGKITTLTYTFDANDRVTKTETRDPLQHLTTINYNSNGMQTSVTDPNNNTTTFEYDPNKPAELVRVTNPLNNSVTMTYDSLGRIESVKDPKGKYTYYGYDAMNRITRVEDAVGGLTRYFYDSKGNLTMVVDAKNHDMRFEYDEWDRLKKMTDQLGRVETYTYYTGAEITPTTGDNLKSITDRKGQTTTFNEYDHANRAKKMTFHDGSYIQYTYDVAGRVDYIIDSISGYIDYTYNDFGCSNCSGRGLDKLSKEVTPLGTIDYTYDKVGRRLSMTVAGQPVVNYTYYDNGLLKEIIRKIGSKARTYTLEYDNGGRRTSLKIPLSLNNKYVTTTYNPYDNANHILNMVIQGPSAQIENLLYEYDQNGNRSKFTRNSAQTLRDGVTEATYNDANHMLTFVPATGSTKSMIYDENGNLTSVTNSCGTTTYTWDARNRLAGINGYKLDCSALVASFKYDTIGRRIEKTINGTTIQYLYDGLDIIQEIQGSAVTNYIRTPDIDEPLTRIRADGTVRHYVRDALGSIIALTDDSGVVKITYTYDSFGNVTVSGESSDNPFQYTGRENDGTGLYYYRARYYSPELQRFISEDPLPLVIYTLHGHPVQLHKYQYVSNNPLNRTDPSGLKECCKGFSGTLYTDCDQWTCLPATPPLPYPRLCARACMCHKVDCNIIESSYSCYQWGWDPGPYPVPGKPGDAS